MLEILSHANKRTRALPALRLPLRELAELYAGEEAVWRKTVTSRLCGQAFQGAARLLLLAVTTDLAPATAYHLSCPYLHAAAPGTAAMARNFAVVYLEQAVARAAPEERFTQAGLVLPPGSYEVSCWGCLLLYRFAPPPIPINFPNPPSLDPLQLPTLLTGLSNCPAQHQQMLLRMAAQVRLVQGGVSQAGGRLALGNRFCRWFQPSHVHTFSMFCLTVFPSLQLCLSPAVSLPQCLEHMATGAASSPAGSEQQFASAYSFLQQEQQQNGEGAAAGGEPEAAAGGAAALAPAGTTTAAADRRLVLRFALQLMLYQPPSAKGPSNPLQAGRGPAPMEVDAPAAGPPAGMSRADVAAVEGKQAPAGVAFWLVSGIVGFLRVKSCSVVACVLSCCNLRIV